MNIPVANKYGNTVDLNTPSGVTITPGAEASDIINVAVRLMSLDGNPVQTGKSNMVQVWLSDNAQGFGLVAVDVSGAVAIGTLGSIAHEQVAKKMWLIITRDGQFDLNITNVGAKTLYFCVQLPSGELFTQVVTFAA